MMEIKVTQNDDRAHFLVEGNIDSQGAEDLKGSFQGLKLSSLKEVVFDFRKVDYIGSAGIGKLLLLYKDLASNGGGIRVENLSASVLELFRELKLDTLFTISKV